MDASRSEAWDRGSLSSWHSDIGIPNNIQEVSGILSFWSTELHDPLKVSKGCEAPFLMRWRPRAFCRVSAVDSDKLSSCDMKDEPAIKPLHRNPSHSRVRASRGPFHFKQKTQGPSHIRIPEGKLLLRSVWKVGLPLQSKTGNQLSSPDDMVLMELSSSCFTVIDVTLDLRWVSRESLDFPKGCQATCCIWCGMRVGYVANAVEMYCILSWFGLHQSILHSGGDISVLLVFWQCSWGFSGFPSRKSRFLTCLIGNMEFVCTQNSGIGTHLAAMGKSHGFSRVEAGKWGIFSSYGRDGHLKLGFVQRNQHSRLVTTDTSVI